VSLPLLAALRDVPVTPGGDQAREWITRELAKSGYKTRPSLWQRFLNWLESLFRSGGTASLGQLLTWLVIVVVIVAVVILAFVVAGPIRRRLGRDDDRGVLTGETRSAAELGRDAAALAQRGEWTDATVTAFRAVARLIEERGILTAAPGRTAVEIAAQAGALLPDLAAALRDCAATFDDLAYGDRPGSEPTYRAAAQLLRAVGKADVVTPVADDGQAGPVILDVPVAVP
jgi:hypothetical protein